MGCSAQLDRTPCQIPEKLNIKVRVNKGQLADDEYLLATIEGNDHIDALSTTLVAFGKHARYASAQATELQDADTADIFTEIARGIDKWLWFVETSQQSGN